MAAGDLDQTSAFLAKISFMMKLVLPIAQFCLDCTRQVRSHAKNAIRNAKMDVQDQAELIVPIVNMYEMDPTVLARVLIQDTQLITAHANHVITTAIMAAAGLQIQWAMEPAIRVKRL